MIKTVTEDKRFCDFCGNEAFEWTQCLKCGKDLCPESAWDSARDKHTVRLAHGVVSSGSDDGYYCLACDIQLSEDKSDDLHNAYVRVRGLRTERDSAYRRQQVVENEAEAEVQRLRRKRGLR